MTSCMYITAPYIKTTALNKTPKNKLFLKIFALGINKFSRKRIRSPKIRSKICRWYASSHVVYFVVSLASLSNSLVNYRHQMRPRHSFCTMSILSVPLRKKLVNMEDSWHDFRVTCLKDLTLSPCFELPLSFSFE